MSARRIGNLVNILSGYAFDSAAFGDSGSLPVVRIRDVVRARSSTYYTGRIDERYVIHDGDVLIGMDGEFNRARWCGGDALLNQRVCRISSSSPELDDKYLFHMLPRALKRIEHATPFVTVKHLSVKQIQDIEIPIPSVTEQRRIAEIMDKADVLRTKRHAALAQIDALSRSMFLDMFGDPATNRNLWREATLGKVADVITGFPFESERYASQAEGIRLCRGTNVLPGRIDWSDLAYWREDDAAPYATFRLAAGDVVLAMDRPWIASGFKIAQIRPGDTPALLVQRVARIRGGDETNNDFLYHLLRHPFFARHCRPTETTIPHISPTDLKSFVFPCPPVVLQRAFADRIRKLNQIVVEQESATLLLDGLFDSVQHRGLRGEL